MPTARPKINFQRPKVPAPPPEDFTDDDGDVPNDVEFDYNNNPDSAENKNLEQAQRRIISPLLKNVSQMIGAGTVTAGVISSVVKPLTEGLVGKMMDYAISQMNSKKPVSRMLVLILEASKFIMEMMDFLTKRGSLIQKIIVVILKLLSGTLGSFKNLKN